MNEQALKEVTAARLEAQSLRRDANADPTSPARAELLDGAARTLTRAISLLRRELRSVEKQAPTSVDAVRLRELLAQTLGSLGGTYRDARNYSAAIEKYDEGNVIEERCRKEDAKLESYNLVQRLVVRLLADPGQLEDPTFQEQLVTTVAELDRQKFGRRDSWFLADVALTRFLRGEPADGILSDLESRNVEASFYESTNNVVSALLGEGLGKGTPLEARLLDLGHLLKRRGGLTGK